MKPSFCAIASQQAGEDLIGTANHYQTYVLIEYPTPWAAKVFTAESLPPTLRQYIKTLKSERAIQFLAISRGNIAHAASAANADASETVDESDSFTLMVYERAVPADTVAASGSTDKNGSTDKKDKVTTQATTAYETVKDYRGHRFQLNALTDIVDCLEAHWQGDRVSQPIAEQNILICTHGMRDKCCARFGQPFFRDAVRSANEGTLPNTQVWKVSHLGGHRFAPTALSFPDGRYYGRLTLSALQAIVQRKGPVNTLRSVYRGWGLLPAPLQVLEQQLILTHGWSWFDHQITYRILSDKEIQPETTSEANPEDNTNKSNPNKRELSVEISIEPQNLEPQPLSSQIDSSNHNTTNNKTTTYRAKLIQDPQKMLAKVSCSSAVAVPIAQYTVTECVVSESLQSKPVAV